MLELCVRDSFLYAHMSAAIYLSRRLFTKPMLFETDWCEQGIAMAVSIMSDRTIAGSEQSLG